MGKYHNMLDNNSVSKVFNNSIIYALSGVLLKCFMFFLLPVYTRYLSSGDYGITSLVNTFLNTFSFVVSLSLYSAITRFYVDLKDNHARLQRFYGTIIIFVFCSSVFFAAFMFIFKDYLCSLFFPGIDFFPCILLCVISLIFFCQHDIYTCILKSQQKAKKCAVVTLLSFLLTVSLNIMFVVCFELQAIGVLIANLVSYILYFFYFIFDLHKNGLIVICFDFKLLKDALIYSVPIIPHNLSTRMANLISQIIIGDKVGMAMLGLYSVAEKFGSIADTFQCYADSAYGPWLFEQLKDKKAGYKNNIRMVSQVIASVLGVFFIIIALFSHDYIVVFLDKSYVESWKLVPLVVSVFSIKIMYYFYVEVLFYYKKASRLLFVATLSGSFMNIFFSYVFIPLYGAYGSVLADGFAMLIRVAIIYFISKQCDDIGLYLKDFLLIIITINFFNVVGLSFSYLKFTDCFSVYNFIFKLLVVLSYISLMLYFYRDIIIPTVKKRLKNKF